MYQKTGVGLFLCVSPGWLFLESHFAVFGNGVAMYGKRGCHVRSTPYLVMLDIGFFRCRLDRTVPGDSVRSALL